MTALSIIASELILLIVKLIYTALESIILTLVPPKEKSLEGEVVLVSYKVDMGTWAWLDFYYHQISSKLTSSLSVACQVDFNFICGLSLRKKQQTVPKKVDGFKASNFFVEKVQN